MADSDEINSKLSALSQASKKLSTPGKVFSGFITIIDAKSIYERQGPAAAAKAVGGAFMDLGANAATLGHAGDAVGDFVFRQPLDLKNALSKTTVAQGAIAGREIVRETGKMDALRADGTLGATSQKEYNPFMHGNPAKPAHFTKNFGALSGVLRTLEQDGLLKDHKNRDPDTLINAVLGKQRKLNNRDYTYRERLDPSDLSKLYESALTEARRFKSQGEKWNNRWKSKESMLREGEIISLDSLTLDGLKIPRFKPPQRHAK